jgi:trans-aconitate methyltransferase
MFDGDLQSYFLVGLSGLRAVENVLKQWPSLTVKTILDLPCGCGRVGRFLTARFPESQITACDLMTEGVDFCAKQLGMIPAYSQPNLEEIAFGQKYDLIWCGSLVTHLKSTDILGLLRLFERHLADNGVVIFTTHGDFVAELVNAGHHSNVASEAAKKAVELYWLNGVAFVPSLGTKEADQYGFSITSPTWVRSQCESSRSWKEIFFQGQGWNNHQDVFGYAKISV